MLEIDVIDTPSLGDRGYLATDGSVALVVDPQRDFDRVLALARARGVEVTHVFETHIHNDYVTGGLALARAVGAAYHVNAADQVSFDRTPTSDGDRIDVGEIAVRVLATPGHTFTHLSYAIEHAGQVRAVFTGGSLLYGSAGRTDLLGPGHSVELTRAQQRSARRLAAELPAETAVYPTHGFGSFCSATPASSEGSTIASEMAANAAFTLAEDEFVTAILAGLDVYPAYYVHMAPANAAGPLAPDLAPPRQARGGELRHRIDAGEWVVDLRSRVAFAAGHLRGARHIELGNDFTTYLGWLIPWGTPLTLIGDSQADVATAQLELARIGIDRLESAAVGDAGAWADGEPLRSYRVASFDEYERAREQGPVVLLDVRRDSEWRVARIEGALHIPLHELAGRIAELPAAQIWVHCQAGYRAAIAASLLDAAGRSVVLIDDDFSAAQRSGLATTGAVPTTDVVPAG